MKIYFAGSIRGGRQKAEDYKKIIQFLSLYGEVLTEHIGDPSLSSQGEERSCEEIYTRDIAWVDDSEVVVAEVTVPSLGVGYEIKHAEQANKKVICLYHNTGDGKLSAMIEGNKKLIVVIYQDLDDLFQQLTDLFSTVVRLRRRTK